MTQKRPWAREESNPHPSGRNRKFYPLNYEPYQMKDFYIFITLSLHKKMAYKKQPQIIHHRTGLKKHHKWMIGGFSTFLIIVLVANSLFIYFLYGQLQMNYQNLENEIKDVQADTQSKFNELTENLMQTKTDINSLSSELGSINEEFSSLKASVGEDFSGIIEEAVKSVVTVRTNVGQGTGFVIDEQGYVVTNAHVLSGASSVRTIDYEQTTESAVFIGADTQLDIALLKISPQENYIELANSNNAQVGEKVIAIGNPLGLQFSVSQGIISGVHREGPNNIDAYIQTDAALNPGNSGGPLINQEGEVIGINNFKIGGGESLGFALESNFIKESVNVLYFEATNQTLI